VVSNYEFEKLLLLNFDCTCLMGCFYCFHDLDSRRKTPVRIAKIRIRAGNRPLTVAAAGEAARPGLMAGAAQAPRQSQSGSQCSRGQTQTEVSRSVSLTGRGIITGTVCLGPK
jgi:hypothetical protein